MVFRREPDMSTKILHTSNGESNCPDLLILPRTGSICNHQGNHLVKNVLGLTKSIVPGMFRGAVS